MIKVWGQSDVGLVRGNNEDSFLLLDLTAGGRIDLSQAPSCEVGSKGFLLLVADGMGGHEAGEVASRLAVEEVSHHLLAQLQRRKTLNRRTFVQALKESIVHANARIYQAGQGNTTHRGMGTTLTAAGIYDGAAFFAQVGDSRGYLLRANVIARMTRDQSLVAELEAAGEVDSARAREHPLKNVLLQALGIAKHVTVPVSFVELYRGDWLLLCSDGLTNLVTDEEIGDTIRTANDVAAACQTLIALANSRGGQDNITVVIAHCDGLALPLPKDREVPSIQEFAAQNWRRFLPWMRKDHAR